MTIGVITYDVPHRKTQDVLFRLKASGYDAECIAFPFINRKKFVPLVKHRITDVIDIPSKVLCDRLGFGYTETVNFAKYDKILIGGANILPKEIIKDFEIINSHPGYMPFVRGLDSLKWAILRGLPIGVTTHVITEEVDWGDVIEQRFIPIEYFDTIHSLGQKTYAMEVDMLINAINISNRTQLSGKAPPPNRRMPHRLEVQMLAKLNSIKR